MTDVSLTPRAQKREGANTGVSRKSSTKNTKGALWKYVLVRAVLIFPTIFILVTLVFVLMRATGDPITAALGGKLTQQQLLERIHQAGYDRPLFVQYVEYIWQVFTGNFGTTLSDNQEVLQLLAHFGSATLELTFYALCVAFLVGIPFGLLAGYFRDTGKDVTLRVFAILCYATPVFFAGLMLKLVFSVWLGWFPISGRASTGAEIQLNTLENPSGIYLIDAIRIGDPSLVSEVLSHAFLPALALGLLTAGVFLRLVRTNVMSTLSHEYIDSARSRGVSEFRLVTSHAFRPALIPIVTVIALQIALLLGGAVLTETTFEWKGLGFQLAHYLQARDFVAVQGIVALLAVIVAFSNFFVDILLVFIDPRVRF